jgi:hypothetical protein
LKLGEYNGLHLAVRASAQHTPVVVIGDAEPFFEHEAEQLGATYLATEAVTREQILALVHRLSDDARPEEHRHDRVAWLDHNRVTTLQRALSCDTPGTPGIVEDGGRRFLVN